MIILKTSNEIALMRQAGRVAKSALLLAGTMIKPGAVTSQIDAAVREYIIKQGATPSFLHYNGFPASCCISLNHEVIHGIPSGRKLAEGDIVKVDVGACLNGYHGDCADTYECGEVSYEAKRLIQATRDSFQAGFEALKTAVRLGDVSSAIQKVIEDNGYSAVRDFIGHGIGRALHEDPNVPNFGTAGRGVRLGAGMTLAIEPMVNAGRYMIEILDDKWTVVTADRSLSAHYENTVALTANGPEILTLGD